MDEMDCTEFKINVETLFHHISLKFNAILREFYEPYGLTGPQAMILFALYQIGPEKISSVARELGMTNSNLSVICRRLEKGGFLQRKRDELDQRVVYLHLTDECKTLMEELEKKITTDYLCKLGDASEEDKQIIIDGLRKLDQLLTAQF